MTENITGEYKALHTFYTEKQERSSEIFKERKRFFLRSVMFNLSGWM